MKEFKTLYKKTSLGQLQTWKIVVDGNSYYTIEGINTLTQSEPTICTGKNIGKVNETTPEEQALLEAQSKYQKKLDKGYSEEGVQASKFFEPMLAFEREKYEKLLFTVPTYVSKKLDGKRCILQNGQLTTRNGKPIVSCPHIAIDYYHLDGELYQHALKNDFNKIMSLTNKTKPTDEDLIESASKIEYWVYDYPAIDGVFSTRYLRLCHDFAQAKFPSYFKLVEAYRVYSMKDIEKYHEEFLEQGFEGTMIRLDLGPYENKRSKQLLKYKSWQDAEWTIIDLEEGQGNRTGCANKVLIQLKSGVICKPTMTGTEEFMRSVWKDKSKVIGKKVTVKYFGFTPDGSLRFPTVKHIIGYES